MKVWQSESVKFWKCESVKCCKAQHIGELFVQPVSPAIKCYYLSLPTEQQQLCPFHSHQQRNTALISLRHTFRSCYFLFLTVSLWVDFGLIGLLLQAVWPMHLTCTLTHVRWKKTDQQTDGQGDFRSRKVFPPSNMALCYKPCPTPIYCWPFFSVFLASQDTLY